MFKKSRGLFRVRFLKSFDASCANVAVHFLAVFNIGNLLYVYFERSSRSTVGVADVVATCLAFPANITYSGHIKHLRFSVIFFNRYPSFFRPMIGGRKTSTNNIPFIQRKSNQKWGKNHKK